MQKLTKPRISVGAVGSAARMSDRDTLRDANALQASRLTKRDPLLLSIDRSVPIKKLVALGRYTDISKGLLQAPKKRSSSGLFEARIIHFDEIISSKDARRRIEREAGGWKVADIEELLALGNTFPHLQGQFPIVGLGTTFKKGSLPLVACLHHGDGPKRYVVLRWLGDDWCGDFAFLAVRKKR